MINKKMIFRKKKKPYQFTYTAYVYRDCHLHISDIRGAHDTTVFSHKVCQHFHCKLAFQGHITSLKFHLGFKLAKHNCKL